MYILIFGYLCMLQLYLDIVASLNRNLLLAIENEVSFGLFLCFSLFQSFMLVGKYNKLSRHKVLHVQMLCLENELRQCIVLDCEDLYG